MAETLAPVTDAQIREAIGATLRNGLRKIYSTEIADAVVIHNHWVWGFNIGENASVLTVDSGPEEGIIHGWIIGLAGLSRARPSGSGGLDLQGQHRLRKTGINRRDVLRTYRIVCYHQIDTGIDSTDVLANSENKLANELDIISDEFSLTPTLGLDNPNLIGHEELQFSPIDVFRFDDVKANTAQGTLGIRTQRPLDLVQY